MKDRCMPTFLGGTVHPFDPRPEEIFIEDIAHQLAFENRWVGVTTFPVSVAQHSVMVADLVPIELKLCALMHDASEAYLKDIPRPFKHLPEFAFYLEAEDRLMRVIADKYNFKYPMHSKVKNADNTMLKLEGTTLTHGYDTAGLDPGLDVRGMRVEEWSWRVAEQKFLQKFNEYTSPEK